MTGNFFIPHLLQNFWHHAVNWLVMPFQRALLAIFSSCRATRIMVIPDNARRLIVFFPIFCFHLYQLYNYILKFFKFINYSF